MTRVHYNRGDEIIEVTIKDESGAKIEVRRCNLSDTKECGMILKWLKDKYNFKPSIPHDFFDVNDDFLKI